MKGELNAQEINKIFCDMDNRLLRMWDDISAIFDILRVYQQLRSNGYTGKSQNCGWYSCHSVILPTFIHHP